MIARSLSRNTTGAAGAEFALVVPILILMLFGIIDIGRFMWTVNKAEKAAQMGVRMAVVTNPVSSSIVQSYVGQCATPLEDGDPIPANCFTQITCTKPGGGATCTAGTANAAAFDGVVARMRQFMPEIQDANVEIIYSPSGLGYAGNPNGPDLAPLVTVRLSGMAFNPIMTLTFATLGLPDARSSLTFEDGAGAVSN